MAKILTAAQMRQADRITIEELGVPGVVLMENAGIHVLRVMEQRYGPLARHRISVLCGKGNNGGDGFVVARQLCMRGIRPLVVLLGDPGALQGDASTNYEIIVRQECRPHVVRDLNDWLALKPDLLATTLLVDAILGTGLSGPVRGFLCEIILDVNESFAGIPVVAVDMPSGLPSDLGAEAGEVIRADVTVTFTAPKAGQVLSPLCSRAGELIVLPIGTPREVYEERLGSFLNLIDREQLKPFAARRDPTAHKGDFGHVLLACGSRGKSGAAAMAGQAALKIGAGLVTIATAQSALSTVAGFMPEIMTEPLPETDTGGISARALEYGRFQKLAENRDVLAAGPGLGTHPDTVGFVRRLVREFDLPTVLDADALNAFAGEPHLLSGRAAPLVLTPHPGEMGRLIGKSASEVQRDRVDIARNFAMEHGVHVVLKGFRTLVAAPDGQVYVNPTGNPGMASGGTGDILTGFIAGLMAQFRGHPLADVLCAAVYLHGLAADLAVTETGEKGLVATDLIRYLPSAWRQLSEPPPP